MAEAKRHHFLSKKVYSNLAELIDLAHDNTLSLAIFKPQRLISFDVEATEREWPLGKLALLQGKKNQFSLFQTQEELEEVFSIVKKLPYKFSDQKGKISRLMIEDWEIGALYWNCLERAKGNEEEAITKVKEKYFNTFSKMDICLFFGTTKEHHQKRAPNPFVIIGVFCPPRDPQLKLLGFSSVSNF